MDILEIVLKNIEIIVILAIIVFQAIAGAIVAQNKKKQRQGTANRQSPQPQPATVHRKRQADNRDRKRALADMETSAETKAAAEATTISATKKDSRKSDILTPNKEIKLTSMARTGIVWSEILQPPVSMR